MERHPQLQVTNIHKMLEQKLLTTPPVDFDDIRQSQAFIRLKGIKHRIKRSSYNKEEKEETKETKKRQPIKMVCKICMEAYPVLPRMSTCTHRLFCQQCCIQFVQAKIYDRTVPIECQSKNCQETIDTNGEIFKKVDDKTREMYFRLTRQLVNKEKPCRKPDCNGFLKSLTCDTCQTRHCQKCQEIQHVGQCIEMSLQRMGAVKNCPKCRTLILKDGGCNHITCPPPCKHEFCYVCLGNWNKFHHLCQQKTQNSRCSKKTCALALVIAILVACAAGGITFWLTKIKN